MEAINLEGLRHASRLAGFEWTDAELEAIRPAVAALQAALERLEAVDLAGVEPTTHYRIL